MKVKPLEWTPASMPGHDGKINGITYRFIKIGWRSDKPYEYGVQEFAALDDAKAAAQKDHEAFILNALETEQ